ncbi:hypothetical protein [Noviherbaspirillum pedocola]|uniref:Uncharacterized protein n=1 Tax=Noviherbaspirillum pedocola TaxID=2801341 RepID=A0A934T1T6_9BURK|nr:hypothetical protein [Noviherbaspirillum pedocola]MBK4736088.1 hypothetical protein [Noviherbaspirillum pedocola]
MNNATLIGTDFARADRQKCLRKIGRPLPMQNAEIAPGIRANAVFGVDVSGSDARSVKAQLAGRFSWRAAWWNLHAAVHRIANRHATQEAAMYTFHRRHQEMHLFWRETMEDTHEACDTIIRSGLRAGIATMLAQHRRKAHRD